MDVTKMPLSHAILTRYKALPAFNKGTNAHPPPISIITCYAYFSNIIINKIKKSLFL